MAVRWEGEQSLAWGPGGLRPCLELMARFTKNRRCVFVRNHHPIHVPNNTETLHRFTHWRRAKSVRSARVQCVFISGCILCTSFVIHRSPRHPQMIMFFFMSAPASHSHFSYLLLCPLLIEHTSLTCEFNIRHRRGAPVQGQGPVVVPHGGTARSRFGARGPRRGVCALRCHGRGSCSWRDAARETPMS